MEPYTTQKKDAQVENEKKRERFWCEDKVTPPMACAGAGTNNTTSDVPFMKLAIEVAKSALNVGEVPVGCIIVLNRPYYYSSNLNEKNIIPENVIISYGCNQVNATRDATRHAEMVRVESFCICFVWNMNLIMFFGIKKYPSIQGSNRPHTYKWDNVRSNEFTT